MTTCFKYCSRGLPTAFFPDVAPSRMFTTNSLCLIVCPIHEWRLFFKNSNGHKIEIYIHINLKIKIYRTIILPVVLYWCETWSLTLREERRLGVFENRVLRRVFGPKRNGVTGEWRKLYNEELNDLYSLPIETNEMGRAYGSYGGGWSCAQDVGGEA